MRHFAAALLIFAMLSAAYPHAEPIDACNASIFIGPNPIPAQQVAATVLAEELRKRSGCALPIVENDVKEASGVNFTINAPSREIEGADTFAVQRNDFSPASNQASSSNAPLEAVIHINIEGASPRALLLGVGHVLRKADWSAGALRIGHDVATRVHPAYAMRGHQLGFRDTANSYDAWDVAQYDQYIRELAIFGTNTIENTFFQDKSSVVMKLSMEQMNIEMSKICAKYDLDYQLWTPADFDLKDEAKRAAALDAHEAMYKTLPRLDAIFFPGGDPGDNPASLVIPFLEDLSKRLAKAHPKAGIWISLQSFGPRDLLDFYNYLDEKEPTWLTGVAQGPSSPPLIAERRKLPTQYKHRFYPDITHNSLCQFPVPWWDPAYALTEGREMCNPRPRFFAQVHNQFAPFTDGFSTYSDGVHDDVNKIVFSQLGTDPQADLREILIDYCRFFFGAGVAARAADGILALERNWEGPLDTNGGVTATLELWSALEAAAPRLHDNWRWRLLLMRARYDQFVRERARHDAAIERQANVNLAAADKFGAEVVMRSALAELNRNGVPYADLVTRIAGDCEDLFKLIGLQTSVQKHHARNFERGAVLGFLNRPLNNAWWLEDEFKKIAAIPDEASKVARLKVIANWETPQPGALYDDIGNVAKSPHVLRGEAVGADSDMERVAIPDFGTFMDAGRSRWRLSWLSNMTWPKALQYEGLDPKGSYTLRTTGRGDTLPLFNGKSAEHGPVYSKEVGEFKEFPVPAEAIADGRLEVTWRVPPEPGVNWRQQSMLTEVWLLKQ